MQHGWAIITVGLCYIGLLFALAAYGDRKRPAWMTGWGRPYIFSFSIAVYCTSWTFFGSVGLAAATGVEFFAVYLGPIIAFTVGSPLLLRIARIAKAQNITSVADFLAARYGKNQSLAIVVSLAALIGSVPYIALQLKAISASVQTVLGAYPEDAISSNVIAFCAMIALAIFSVLFGTRHISATEHQSGLMLAIAVESLVKVTAFLAVGIFVTWGLFDGLGSLMGRAGDLRVIELYEATPDLSIFLILTLLSFFAIFLLPRQFHVAIVESRGETEIRRAAWLVPLYMVAINIFVIPLAIAGTLIFHEGTTDPDMYVLSVPMIAGSHFATTMAFVGGLSAATAMVVVECVALAIMLSNNIAIPLFLRSRKNAPGDMRRFLVGIRRAFIVAILLIAYIYYYNTTASSLASIGLLSFAAIAQLAPAFFGGLFWRRASGKAAILSILTGLSVWAYTLLLPSIGYADLSTAQMVGSGLFGLDLLRPTELFGLKADPLVHGVIWSLGLNTIVYIVGSLNSSPLPMERLQANAFLGSNSNSPLTSFHSWHTPVRVGELQQAVGRYLGHAQTAQAFQDFAASRNVRPSAFDEADVHLMRYAELLLASVIGPSSSRLVLSHLLRQGTITTKAALRLLDEASVAVQNSRDLLQTALDHARHGVAVYDSDFRLVCWNREYVRMFSMPENFLRVGKPIDEVIRNNAERGVYGRGNVEDIVVERMQTTVLRRGISRMRLRHSNRVIEVRTDDIPGGGAIATFTDITETVVTEKALETRVKERTRELSHLNQELARAKAQADSANYSKTRFLAAASHDILQPLNAARLYVASLSEQTKGTSNSNLVSNVDASLQSVEEIFSVLLDISRLDAGAFTPTISSFPINDILRQLELEFLPTAQEKGIDLRVIGTSVIVRSDRRMLRRVLQNLVSNAIKYTPEGCVLMGVRRRGEHIRIEVWDTGLGIPKESQETIFKEFQRLAPGAKAARGLGLGLSIVERVTRILGHPLGLRSKPGSGTVFTLEVPVSTEAVTSPAPAPPVSGLPSSPGLQGLRILCIDNEPAILDGMLHLLEKWGCMVMAATDLESAIEVIEQQGRPEVVLVDYHLDDGDGLSLMRKLRVHLKRDIPGVLITADRGSLVRESARAQGLELLHKPLRPAALRALLSQICIASAAAE